MDTQTGSKGAKRYLLTAVFADDVGFPSSPDEYFDEKSWTPRNNRFRVQMTEEQCEWFFKLPSSVRSVLEVCVGQLNEPVKQDHYLLSSPSNLPLVGLYRSLYMHHICFSGWYEPGGNIRYWGTFSYGAPGNGHLCVAERVLQAMDRVSYLNQGYPAPSTQLADDRFVKIFTSELEQDITPDSREALSKLQISSQVTDTVFSRALKSPVGCDAKNDLDLLTAIAWTKGLV